MSDAITTGDAAAPTTVAESLSTVGYAMFALLQTGPLDQVPSLRQFIEQVRAEEAQAVYTEPAYVGDPEETAFGDTDVDENMGALTHGQPLPPAPVVPVLTSVPPPEVKASSVQIPVVPPVAPVPAARASGDPEPVTSGELPGPKNPVVPLPEYNGKETLAMLQEISFLDE